MFSAAYGGVGPGLIATLLSVAAATLFFKPQAIVMLLAPYGVPLLAVIGVGASFVVGKLRQANESLVWVKSKLEEANQRLSEHSAALTRSNDELRHFAHSVAHALHNPLRNVGTLTKLFVQLNAGNIDERSRQCAGMIASGVGRMESLIQGLLDYAATGEGRGGEAVSDCNAALEQVRQDLQQLIETAGASVVYGSLPSVPVNKEQLVQLFSNLISNAIKYQSARRPEIRISATEQEKGWLFSVSDNGIGLDMKYADTIFEMFKRLHTSEQYEGTGIGLALCKAIIQNHGGKIWVESKHGKGATFFFTLPKRTDASLESPPQRLPAKSERGHAFARMFKR